MKNKKGIIILSVLLTLTLTGCKDNKMSNNKTNPISEATSNQIAQAIKQIDTITDVCVVTEDNDPNGKLNKSGGYTGALYFSDSRTGQETISDENTFEERKPIDACEAGTIFGGSIEIYSSIEDAENRNEYLSTFDSTALASGHKLYKNILIRTSDEFSATQQNQITDEIIDLIDKIK